jgi:ribose 5-phosphate isomerase B
MQTVLMASDHAGFEMKEFIRRSLETKGYIMKDYGTFSNESMDYPDAIHPLAHQINIGNYFMGIILCGSGNGVNMVANKYPYVRSALCWMEEIASLARKHNDANILALPARFVDKQKALEIAMVFLNTNFEGGRHLNRIQKIAIDKPIVKRVNKQTI